MLDFVGLIALTCEACCKFFPARDLRVRLDSPILSYFSTYESEEFNHWVARPQINSQDEGSSSLKKRSDQGLFRYNGQFRVIAFLLFNVERGIRCINRITFSGSFHYQYYVFMISHLSVDVLQGLSSSNLQISSPLKSDIVRNCWQCTSW